MSARIYRPAKTAMQSGRRNAKRWIFDYEPERSCEADSLMGWTGSGDMKQQIRLCFDTSEEAVAYAERHGIAYRVFDEHKAEREPKSYAENFAWERIGGWTH
ncbi:MAG: ETC complex I subunit [Hyphomicrobiales bacterium]